MVAVLTERETLELEGIYKWNFFVVFPILYVVEHSFAVCK